MEENIIVSEVSFSEKSNGAAVADGFFISSGKGIFFFFFFLIFLFFFFFFLKFYKCLFI